MTYRDDREALHHRVAQLEEELKDARREGQEEGRDEAEKRAKVLEGRIGDMKGELERMELELQAMRGEQPGGAAKPASKPANVAAGAVCVVIMVGIFVMLRRPETPAPVIVMSPPAPLTMEKTAEPPKAVATLEPAPEATTEATPAVPQRTTTARWNARVAKADGLAIAGAACTLDATIATNNETNAILRDFTVTCGGQKLYSSKDKLEGMAQMSNDARELLGPADDKSTFTLVYRDMGTRSGERAQIDLDTNAKQGTVWRDTIPRFKIDLTIPKESAPGTPLSGADQRLKRTGKLTEASGAGAPKTGAT